MIPTPEQALELLKQYNEEPFHIKHGVTVGATLRWFACELGFEQQADFWHAVGILHDLDYERWPEEHCVKCIELMGEHGLDEELIHAVASHGYPRCGNTKPESLMEKVLYAVDELTGLIGAAALMRPSKSVQDMELKSLKKKFKDKKFAAGCSRDVIQEGADQLGWSLDELLERTLKAMQATETMFAD